MRSLIAVAVTVFGLVMVSGAAGASVVLPDDAAQRFRRERLKPLFGESLAFEMGDLLDPEASRQRADSPAVWVSPGDQYDIVGWVRFHRPDGPFTIKKAMEGFRRDMQCPSGQWSATVDPLEEADSGDTQVQKAKGVCQSRGWGVYSILVRSGYTLDGDPLDVYYQLAPANISEVFFKDTDPNDGVDLPKGAVDTFMTSTWSMFYAHVRSLH